MIIGQQVQTQLIYIQPLRIELSASIPSSSFCFFKVLPLEKRVLALAVRCIGFVSGAIVPTAQLTMEETRYNEGVQAVKTGA
jgi:hypothetical protein